MVIDVSEVHSWKVSSLITVTVGSTFTVTTVFGTMLSLVKVKVVVLLSAMIDGNWMQLFR